MLSRLAGTLFWNEQAVFMCEQSTFFTDI